MRTEAQEARWQEAVVKVANLLREYRQRAEDEVISFQQVARAILDLDEVEVRDKEQPNRVASVEKASQLGWCEDKSGILVKVIPKEPK